MSFFDGKKLFLFSNVDGNITYKSEPASNTRVNRYVKWNATVYEDSTELDGSGNFHFDAIIKHESSILPKEFNAYQKITAIHNEHEYLLWETVKGTDEKNSELEGAELVFECELTEAPRFVHLLHNSIETICTWNK